MAHQISIEILHHFVNRTILAGNTEDSNGKQLILHTEINEHAEVMSSFEVRAGTNEINGETIYPSTRLLREAVEKYNSL